MLATLEKEPRPQQLFGVRTEAERLIAGAAALIQAWARGRSALPMAPSAPRALSLGCSYGPVWCFQAGTGEGIGTRRGAVPPWQRARVEAEKTKCVTSPCERVHFPHYIFDTGRPHPTGTVVTGISQPRA